MKISPVYVGDKVKTPRGIGTVIERFSLGALLRTMSNDEARLLLQQVRARYGDDGLGGYYRVYVETGDGKIWGFEPAEVEVIEQGARIL